MSGCGGRGGGGDDRNINTGEARGDVIHFIDMNPVRRGLVKRPTDWKWSSAGAWAGIEGPLAIDRDLGWKLKDKEGVAGARGGAKLRTHG